MNIYQLANKLISVIKSMIDEEIIICDVNGTIITSSEAERIGDYHEGAAEVIESNQQLIITEQLASKLKGVKTGINLPIFFNKSVIGVIGITGNIDKVQPFGELVRKMTELLINENYYHEQLEFEHRARETFLFEWLQSNTLHKALVDRAKTLGISLEGQKQVILLSMNKEESVLHKDIWQYVKTMIPENDVLIRWGNDRLLWVHTVNKSFELKTDFLKNIQQNCEKNFHITAVVGVGERYPANQIRQSYEQALTAIDYNPADDGVTFHKDLQLELCLQDISNETKTEFINRTIGGLLHHKQLLHSLRVFLDEELSYQRTADKLYIHVNTLHYRLTRIKQMTNLDPKNFKDLTRLYLSIIFLDEHTIFE